jgi:signal transduction histidine kinase
MNAESLRKLKHELRTPVNHILGYSELLLETADDTGDSNTASLARGIHARGQTLAKLLEKSLLSPSGDMDEAQMGALRDSIRPVLSEIMETLSSTTSMPERDSHTDDLDRIRRAANQLIILVEADRASVI